MSVRQRTQHCCHFTAIGGFLRRGFGKQIAVLIAAGSSLSLPSCGNRQVTNGRIQKRGHLSRQFEAGELSNKVGKRFLSHILSIVVVSGESKSQIHHPVFVAMVQRCERVLIAVVDGGHQLQISQIVSRCRHSGQLQQLRNSPETTSVGPVPTGRHREQRPVGDGPPLNADRKVNSRQFLNDWDHRTRSRHNMY